MATDGGEGSLDGKGMQADWQDGKVVIQISWGGSQDCNGKAFGKLLKYLQHRIYVDFEPVKFKFLRLMTVNGMIIANHTWPSVTS
jgi:hypothetical protein